MGGAPLVTIVGSGGVGKTRLVFEFMTLLKRKSFCFADIAHCRKRSDVIHAVANCLGLQLHVEDAESARELIGRVLASGRKSVVVLDNVEQVSEETALLLTGWLKGSRTQFIVTSRRRLRVSEDTTIVLRGLALPEPGARLEQIQAAASVQLFCQRARLAHAQFQLSTELAQAACEIVNRLDGVPLAIELAAARVAILSLPQILTRLDSQLHLLSRGQRDQPARHLTMRACVAWSWELVEPLGRRLLAICSVFRGGFDLEAAEALASGHIEPLMVMDQLQLLVDSSLLQTLEAGANEKQRYRMFVSVREYAESRLDEVTAESAQQAHLEYYCRRGSYLFDGIIRFDDDNCRRQLGQEFENLQVAWQRSLGIRDVERCLSLALAVEWWMRMLAPVHERLRVLNAALECSIEAPPAIVGLRAQVQVASVDALAALGQTDLALETVTRARAVLTRAGSIGAQAWAWYMTAEVYAYQAKRALALKTAQKAAGIHEAVCDHAPARDGRINLAVAIYLSDLDRFRESLIHAKDALQNARRRGCGSTLILALQSQVAINLFELDPAGKAEEALLDSLRKARSSDVKAIEFVVLRHVGLLCNAQERFGEAVTHLEAAFELGQDMGEPVDQLCSSNDLVWCHICAGDNDRAAQVLSTQESVDFLPQNCWQAIYGVILDWRAGKLASALKASRRLVEFAAHPGLIGRAPLLFAMRAALLALRGELDEADACFTKVEELSRDASPGPVVAASRVFAAFRELTQYCLGLDGAAHRGQRLVDLAVSSSSLDLSHLRRGFLPRIAAKLLIEAFPPNLKSELNSRLETTDNTSLLVNLNTGCLRPPGHPWIDLSKKPTLIRLMGGLIELRRRSPGRSLQIHDLWEIGWPDEQIGAGSAANRIYYHVATLRKLGFRDVLLKDGDGYRLDERVAIVEIDA